MGFVIPALSATGMVSLLYRLRVVARCGPWTRVRHGQQEHNVVLVAKKLPRLDVAIASVVGRHDRKMETELEKFVAHVCLRNDWWFLIFTFATGSWDNRIEIENEKQHTLRILSIIDRSPLVPRWLQGDTRRYSFDGDNQAYCISCH